MQREKKLIIDLISNGYKIFNEYWKRIEKSIHI